MMNKMTIAFVEIGNEDGEELAARPSLKQLLLSDVGRGELVLPAREGTVDFLVRHRQWQAGLEPEAFFDQVFGTVPAS